MILGLHHQIQQALQTILAAKLRSFLAVLGILVGTASIVALISCGQLATEKALAEFKALGTDLISISIFPQANSAAQEQRDIPLDAWRLLPNMIHDIKQIAPYSTAYQPISFQGKPIKSVIVGADESLAQIIHINMEKGHFVSFVETYEHFCVIGSSIAKQLQQIYLSELIGHQIRIGQILYTIIGIAKPWHEDGFFNENVNRAIFIPLAGMPLISKDAKISNAIIRLKPNNQIDSVITQIKRTIHMYAPNLNIYVRSAKQIIASMESQGQIFTLLLAIIGSISLVVGGIGVMNIMLVSVSERKKEIGIRKAVGGKNRDIQMLFLIESILLSCLGGILGVIVGQILTWIIALFSQWPFKIYLMPLLVGFSVSVITGIFFGFYPARRAAYLLPIESLRNE